nr:hypothetical protein [Tanacetum cinerariifolium]
SGEGADEETESDRESEEEETTEKEEESFDPIPRTPEESKDDGNGEAFREMLHISPRVPGQSFDELPFEEEILDFLRFLRHSAQIKTLTDININKLFQHWRSFAAVINKCLTRKSSSFDSFRNTKAYKEYYAYATGEAAPKLKASARRKRGGSDSSTTHPT